MHASMGDAASLTQMNNMHVATNPYDTHKTSTYKKAIMLFDGSEACCCI